MKRTKQKKVFFSFFVKFSVLGLVSIFLILISFGVSCGGKEEKAAKDTIFDSEVFEIIETADITVEEGLVICTCEGKECGDDGCGGNCGTCTNPCTYKLDNNICINGQCTIPCCPSCFNKICGDDGCGGNCGNCQQSYICDNGKCVYSASCGNGNCDEEESYQNCPQDCKCGDKYCSENENYCNCFQDCLIKCGDGCCSSGENYQNCSQDCKCIPNCTGKECGNNGCGGFCGVCNENKICVKDLCCLKQCSDKKCGDDGCGGSCGKCALGYECSNGKCIPCINTCNPDEKPYCSGNTAISCIVSETNCYYKSSLSCSWADKCFKGSCYDDPSCGGELGSCFEVGSYKCSGVSCIYLCKLDQEYKYWKLSQICDIGCECKLISDFGTCSCSN